MKTFRKKYIPKMVRRWRCGYQGIPVSRWAPTRLAHAGSPWEKAGHPFVTTLISLLAGRRLLLFLVHSHSVVGRGTMAITRLVPSLLSLPSFVWSSRCLLSFLPVEFSKARIPLPLATWRVYSIFDVWDIKQMLVLTVQK